MITIPEVNDADVAFGNIKHLPAWEQIPQEFKNDNNPYHRMAMNIFYKGHVSEEDGKRYGVREGLDPQKVKRAITAILVSWAPRHEHKMAGVAYLLSEWFEEDKDYKPGGTDE